MKHTVLKNYFCLSLISALALSPITLQAANHNEFPAEIVQQPVHKLFLTTVEKAVNMRSTESEIWTQFAQEIYPAIHQELFYTQLSQAISQNKSWQEIKLIAIDRAISIKLRQILDTQSTEKKVWLKFAEELILLAQQNPRYSSIIEPLNRLKRWKRVDSIISNLQRTCGQYLPADIIALAEQLGESEILARIKRNIRID